MKTTARATCTHPGCTESAFWSFDTRKEAAAHYPQRQKWKCGRHYNPDRNLGLDRMEIITVITNEKVMYRDTDRVLGLFWNGNMGLTRGDGYRADAKDFPEGTRLIVTARIELPAGGGGAKHGDGNGESKNGACSPTEKAQRACGPEASDAP